MSNEIAKLDTTMADVPDYLREETSTGINGLDSSDFKLPRIKLLQALSPEVRNYPGKALPGHFWHTGANISLGADFKFIPATAGKRVILWSSRDNNAELLAFSQDGRNWTSGGNSSFSIKVKGSNDKITVKTGKNVLDSRLVEWGSSNPADPKSPPAATLIYEYLAYLPAHPELSPCFLGMYRTAIDNAKKLNTSLLYMRKPLYTMVVDCVSETKNEGGYIWNVPSFKLAGWAAKEDYQIAKKFAEQYEQYVGTYDPTEIDGGASTSNGGGSYSSSSGPSKKIDDNIPF